MKHSGNASLFNHWLSIRNGRRIPDRSDLDPIAIRDMLGFTFMLEVDGNRASTRNYPVRVSGTRLDALFGRSVKDESFTAFWQPQDAAKLRAVMETVLDDGMPAVMSGTAAPHGYPSTPVELLLLPLRCQGRTHARLFCSLAPLAIPSWLGLRGIEPLSLGTWRMLDPAQPPQAGARTADTHAVFASAEARRRRFTVVEGGRAAAAPVAIQPVQSDIKPLMPRLHTAVLSSQAP